MSDSKTSGFRPLPPAAVCVLLVCLCFAPRVGDAGEQKRSEYAGLRKHSSAKRQRLIEKFKRDQATLISELVAVIENAKVAPRQRAQAADQLAALTPRTLVAGACKHLGTTIPLEAIDSMRDEMLRTPYVHVLQADGLRLITRCVEEVQKLSAEDPRIGRWADVLRVHLPHGMAGAALFAWHKHFFAGKNFTPPPGLKKLMALLPHK